MRKEEIKLESTHLVEYMDDKYPFYLDPMPNLSLVTHASIGRGMTVNRMFWRARRRESIFIIHFKTSSSLQRCGCSGMVRP